jgi:hypothetical protein
MRRSRLLALASATAVAGALATVSPSTADPAPTPQAHTLASGLVTPLSLAVQGGSTYVTQNFAGMLTQLRRGQEPRTLYTSENGNEVGGVSVRGHRVVFTETAGDGEGNNTDSWLKMLTRSGAARTIADIRDYENATNPDGKYTYGARGISDDCAAQWPTDQIGPATYTGALDSHPYATLQTRRTIYVADAGMNAVLAVSRGGHIRTVAVTPPVAVPITADLASQMGVPDCAVGLTYYGESVPTDVELDPHGRLIVTTEGGGLGEQMPLGSIYRVDRCSGHLKRLVGGLMTPTGVAVGPRGTMWVAQLFANEISMIAPGSHRVRTFAQQPLPAAVELADGHVYATVNVLPADDAAPDGQVVRFSR